MAQEMQFLSENAAAQEPAQSDLRAFFNNPPSGSACPAE
jgi:hypothetical protein